jgi:hypothetical protein
MRTAALDLGSTRTEARMRSRGQLHERATLAVTPIALFFAAAQSPIPDVTPDVANTPGAEGLEDAINVFAVYALFASLAGFILGAVVWAVGGRAGNDYAAQGGKVGMGVAVGVAFLVGAATAIVKFAYGAGGT